MLGQYRQKQCFKKYTLSQNRSPQFHLCCFSTYTSTEIKISFYDFEGKKYSYLVRVRVFKIKSQNRFGKKILACGSEMILQLGAMHCRNVCVEKHMRKRMYICKCDWVTSLYSRKLTEQCKPAIKEKVKIVNKKLEEKINMEN